MTDACEASLYRGEWSTLRTEPCGKPGRGYREDGHGHSVPLCGIHMRARNVLHFQDRNLAEGVGKGWVR